MNLLIISKNQFFLKGTKYELEEDGIYPDISDRYIPGYDFYVVDTDTADVGSDIVSENAKIITLSHDKECDIALPFHIYELEEMLDGIQRHNYIRSAERGCDTVTADIPKLTGCEKKILEMLVARSPEAVKKDEIFYGVFKKAREGSNVVNVYINSLRKKIEKDGVRVILTDRKKGFRIDKVTSFLLEILKES